MTAFRARAPATIGNVGPGFDVLGLAVDGLGIEVTLTPGGRGPRLCAVTGRDAELIPTDPERNAALLAARLCCQQHGAAADFALDLHNELPFAGGLGGSAGAAAAGAVAALAMLGREPGPDAVLPLSLAVEERLAGRHLDNVAAAVLGGLTIARDPELPDAVRAPTPVGWHVALVTPRARVSTQAARALLPRQVPRELWTRQMAATAAVVLAFVTGDAELLRRSLHDAFAEPVRAPLIPNFAAIQRAALAAGALGCSIAGSGPTVFALARDRQHGAVLADAMAAAAGEVALRHVGAIAARGAHTP